MKVSFRVWMFLLSVTVMLSACVGSKTDENQVSNDSSIVQTTKDSLSEDVTEENGETKSNEGEKEEDIILSNSNAEQITDRKEIEGSSTTVKSQEAPKAAASKEKAAAEAPIEVENKKETETKKEEVLPDASQNNGEINSGNKAVENQGGNFKNGVYRGTGEGKNGIIKVQVKVENNKISQISILEHEDTDRLAEKVFQDLTKRIIAQQNTEVDIISGATMTSKGFIEAVRKSLNES